MRVFVACDAQTLTRPSATLSLRERGFAGFAVLLPILLGLLLTASARPSLAAEAITSGEVKFAGEGEDRIPERFRLEPATFAFEQQPLPTVSTTMHISTVTFPSPVVTPHVKNNTVHCEYFCPVKAGPHPGVIVLHILGGDFDLARLFCRQMAQNGVAALFLKMPYYGPRRQEDNPTRMVSSDVRQTVQGMTQAVMDIRRAATWLGSRPEVDPGRLGIFGISLGGITAALAASVEPRFHRVCLMLAGGDIGRVGWTSPDLAPLRDRWVKEGGTREEFFALMKTVDPVTYAGDFRGREVLMINAQHDEVIPPSCTVSLWEAFGKPKIIWLDAGHYTAMRFIFDGLARVTHFFQAPVSEPANTGR
jgi:cephalosporin-C deacetylase-like acetyl esterase